MFLSAFFLFSRERDNIPVSRFLFHIIFLSKFFQKQAAVLPADFNKSEMVCTVIVF